MRHGIFRVACLRWRLLAATDFGQARTGATSVGEGDTSSAAPLTEHRLSPEDRYTPEKGYGYDLLASPDEGGDRPYYVSVQVPDGNYRVTVLLGNRKGSRRYHGTGGVAPLVFGKRADEERGVPHVYFHSQQTFTENLRHRGGAHQTARTLQTELG